MEVKKQVFLGLFLVKKRAELTKAKEKSRFSHKNLPAQILHGEGKNDRGGRTSLI